MRHLLAALCIAASVGVPLATAQQTKAPDGAQVFRQNCASCHSVQEGKNGVGPSLYGVVGRRSASAPGYTRYTPAMKAANLQWTEANIDRYITNPSAVVPRAGMSFRLNDAAKRQAVIAYLKTTAAPAAGAAKKK